MSEFISGGQGSYRTRLFATTEQAFAFARCLHNNDRFEAVEVCQSKKAPGKWFVTFRPSNPARQQAILDRQQDARAQRAAEGDFLFIEDRGFVWVVNQETGGCYAVDAHSCSCPDHLYRLRDSGVECKHRLAVRNQCEAAAAAYQARVEELAQAA
jgi:predicted nucleic acid-binding Zn finger protein